MKGLHPKRSVRRLKPEANTRQLILKLARALSRPGIDRAEVFGDTYNPRVYSYYVCPTDPSKIVRESVNGTRTIGHVVGGCFRAI